MDYSEHDNDEFNEEGDWADDPVPDKGHDNPSYAGNTWIIILILIIIGIIIALFFLVWRPNTPTEPVVVPEKNATTTQQASEPVSGILVPQKHIKGIPKQGMVGLPDDINLPENAKIVQNDVTNLESGDSIRTIGFKAPQPIQKVTHFYLSYIKESNFKLTSSSYYGFSLTSSTTVETATETQRETNASLVQTTLLVAKSNQGKLKINLVTADDGGVVGQIGYRTNGN